MGNQSSKWIYDSRGQRIPLRPDPEGIWHHQQSFRLNITTGHRLIKKHPRIAVVLAMREVPALYFRPDTRKDWGRAYVYQIGNAALLSAIIYGLLLKDFFGTRNWAAMLISFAILLVIHMLSAQYNWRKADRRMAEMIQLFTDHPLYCAGCWYPLVKQLSSEGVVICPECGAAWGFQLLESMT